MNPDLAAAVLFVSGVLVLVVALVVCGFGAWLWANATAAAHRARAHGAEADARIVVDTAAVEAADSIVPPSPSRFTDEELMAPIRAARAAAARATNGHATTEEDFSTLGNEGAEPDRNPYEERAFNL